MRVNSIKKIGIHQVSCSSIEHPVVDRLFEGSNAKLFFSDPPWGDGNLKYWSTMNEKMTGKKFTPLTYDQLLARIIQLIQSHVEGHIMIETGLRWAESMAKDFKQFFHNIRIINVEYKAGKKMLPSAIVYATTDLSITPYKGVPKNKSGYKVVSELINRLTNEGDTVLDPCCGMGYTAQACIDHNLIFRGNEFNSKRLEKTIKRLS